MRLQFENEVGIQHILMEAIQGQNVGQRWSFRDEIAR